MNYFYRFFEYFILSIICTNSIALAIYDYSDRNNLTKRNQIVNSLSTTFSVLFMIEFLLKVIAYGFIFHKKGYIRDGWNILDFIVVIAGWVALIIIKQVL